MFSLSPCTLALMHCSASLLLFMSTLLLGQHLVTADKTVAWNESWTRDGRLADFSAPLSLLSQPSANSIPEAAKDAPPGHDELLMYRVFASMDSEASDPHWNVHLRGVVIRRPTHLAWHQRALLRGFQAVIRPSDSLEARRSQHRLGYFIADTLGDRYSWVYGIETPRHERMKALRVRHDGSIETDHARLDDGHYRPGDVVELSWQPPPLPNGRTVNTQFASCFFYGPRGFSIVADIDDTLKDSHVSSIPRLLDQTFLKVYEPVPGMPAVFRHWSRVLSAPETPDVAFHYISSTPYMLLRSLDHFLRKHDFPAGPIHLDELRVKDPGTLIRILNQPKFKREEAQRIAQAFPLRRIILVGDSVQRDAQAFAELLRDDPDSLHYQCALIRHVLSDKEGDEDKNKRERRKLEEKFEDVDRKRYFIFEKAEELLDIDIGNGACRPSKERRSA